MKIGKRRDKEKIGPTLRYDLYFLASCLRLSLITQGTLLSRFQGFFLTVSITRVRIRTTLTVSSLLCLFIDSSERSLSSTTFLPSSQPHLSTRDFVHQCIGLNSFLNSKEEIQKRFPSNGLSLSPWDLMCFEAQYITGMSLESDRPEFQFWFCHL